MDDENTKVLKVLKKKSLFNYVYLTKNLSKIKRSNLIKIEFKRLHAHHLNLESHRQGFVELLEPFSNYISTWRLKILKSIHVQTDVDYMSKIMFSVKPTGPTNKSETVTFQEPARSQ